jgi:ArsR family transcriptional regulator
MDIKAAVHSLAALAQDSRLEVYRQLVQAGPEGVAAGELAGHIGSAVKPEVAGRR